MDKRKYLLSIWEQKTRIICAAVLIALLCAGYAAYNRKWSGIRPFETSIQLEEARMSVNTVQGDTYVVDQSCNRILKLDREGKVCAVIPGGNEKKAFCYAVSIQPAKDGGFYLLDHMKSDHKNSFTGERIHKFEADGKHSAVIYQETYDEKQWLCNTKILLNMDGVIHAVRSDHTGLTLINMEKEEDAVQYPFENADRLIKDYTIKPGTGILYFLTKRGEIGFFPAGGQQASYIYKSNWNEEKRILSALSFTSDGQLYVTDTKNREICKVDEGNINTYLELEDYFYDVRVLNGFTVCGVKGIYDIKDSGTICRDTFPLTKGLMAGKLLYYASCCYLILFLSAAVIAALKYIHLRGTPVMQASTAFLAVIFGFTILFSMITIKNVNERFTEEMILRARTAAEIIAENIPSKAFLALDRPEAFLSEDYEAVRKAVEKGFIDSNGERSDLYCVLYSMDGMEVLERYRLDESCGAGSVCPWEGVEESEIIQNREIRQYVGESTSEGSFIFVLVPILDESGNGCGLIEVGKNIEAFDEENRNLVLELFINIIALAAVLFMIVLELIIYIQSRKGYQREKEKSENVRVPASVWRMLVFLIFFITNISTGFLPILANHLAENMKETAIAPSVLAAVPISVEVLTGAVFSVYGSRVIQRMGQRKAGMMGAAFFLLGLCLRIFCQNFWLLTLGSAVQGCGWGLLLLIANINIAAEEDETVREEGFTGYSAAVQNGVNAGVVFGGFLLYWMDYQKVFLAGALLGLLVLWFVRIYIRDGETQEEKKETAKIPFVKFLFSPRVLLYFIGIVLPIAAAGYYMNYLYPVIGAQFGISETNIGYSYLIHAFFIMACGNVLTRYLTRRLAKKWVIVLSAALYTVSFLLTGWFQSVPALFLTLALLGIANSFGGPVQSSYFAELPEVAKYGYDRSVGILGLVSNLSETCGPFLFGCVLAAGLKQGLVIMASVILVLAVIFGVTGCSAKRRK